ncbi:MAG TPA: fatty acid desaturase [Sphingomicrobium sp.]|nr:fatty acid desaturase [Sphingomicrobium sp.]
MLIANSADRLNVARGLAAPIILFIPFWHGFSGGQLAVVFIVTFALIGETNYILHLHVHRPFATRAWLNLLLDLGMGAATGMTASNWRIQHRYGHHRGIDLPFRASHAWEMERYSPLRALSFTTRSILPTFWRPIVEAFRKGVLRNEREPINYRWAFVEQMLLIMMVAALLAWKPLLVLGFLLPWYVLTAMISRYVDYLNHYGCDERSSSPFDWANNCLNRTFNRGCCNFGYHTAHHYDPSAHWTELPGIHRRIADSIPERYLKTFSWSCLLFPYHVFLAQRGRT